VKKGTAAMTAGDLVIADPTVSGAVCSATPGLVITTAANGRGLLGTVATTVTAGATTVNVYFGKF
jgi:hypothetical protein